MARRQRKIIHCDADCFFAAVEMRDDPGLRDRPLAVGGSAARRGVIAACNYLAREYGVHSAMPSAHARRLCPDLLILPPDMERYRQVSRRIQEIFHDYTDSVEPLSLDEAYLDVSESERCHGSATLMAREIRQRVWGELGITISAGVSSNKFLAKVASDWHKPDGLTIIPPEEVDDFVAQLPVRKIPGVGRVSAQKLENLGVWRCFELQTLGEVELFRRFGSLGLRLDALSRGRDERPVQASRQRKSVSVEKTYARDLPDLHDCLTEIPGLLERLESRLARLESRYRIVKAFVKVKFNDFDITTLERLGSTPGLGDYHQLCREAFSRRSRPVRLLGLGVRLADSRAGVAPGQLKLFGPC